MRVTQKSMTFKGHTFFVWITPDGHNERMYACVGERKNERLFL